MKSTPYEMFTNVRFPPEVQRRRVRTVMEHELTETQRRAIQGHFFEGRSIRELAREQGVQPSSVWKAIQRGLRRMARCLRY